jgi:hypothetical protein
VFGYTTQLMPGLSLGAVVVGFIVVLALINFTVFVNRRG